jgi:murein DD-endopeptidase MepM/ murein hydrolase activator NlpD
LQAAPGRLSSSFGRRNGDGCNASDFERVMKIRGRSVLTFILGFVTGAFFIALLLWWSGGLRRAGAAAAAAVRELPREHRSEPARRSARTPARVQNRGSASRSAASETAERPTVAKAAGIPEPQMSDYERLLRRPLQMPVAVDPRDIHDSFSDVRSGRRSHEACDIMAPRGTPVKAMDDGVIKKLLTSEMGGLTIYQFDREEIYCYFYAHLDRYADGIHEGMTVNRGDLIAYAGSTGNASPDAPHLHLAIFKLGPDMNWWQGTPINPYPVLMGLAQK